MSNDSDIFTMADFVGQIMSNADLPFGDQIERISGNAYRMLGLPADAGVDRILEARDTLLRSLASPKPVETSWDIPWLGPLLRREADIRAAEERLRDAPQRMLQKLFWFSNERDILTSLTPSTLPIIALHWTHSTDPLHRHGAALLYLARAQMLDPAFNVPSAWAQTIKCWTQLAEDDAFWTLLVASEIALDAPPEAITQIGESLREHSILMIVHVLLTAIERARDRGDTEAAQRGSDILQALDLPSFIVPLDATADDTPQVEDDASAPVETPLPVADSIESPIDDPLIQATNAQLGQLQAAAQLLQEAWALLPQDVGVTDPIAASLTRLQEHAVTNFEELCAEIVLSCQRDVPSRQDGNGAAPGSLLTGYERAMARYEHEVKTQVQQLLALIGPHSLLARRVWEAAAYCLYCLVVIWPWDDERTRADVLLETAREHLPADSRMLQRFTTQLTPRATPPPAVSPIDMPSPVADIAPHRRALRPRPVTLWALGLLVVLLFASAMLVQRYVISAHTALITIELKLQQASARIAEIQQELQARDTELTELAARIQQAQYTLNEHERLRRQGQTVDASAHRQALHTYNALVPEYNNLTRQQDELTTELAALISAHDRMTDEYNTLQDRSTRGSPPDAPIMPLRPLAE